MPLITALLTAGAIAAGVGGTVAGAKEASNAQGIQQQGLKDENAIAQQEMQDKQQIFKQLTDFFSPYLKSGSPFLQNIQSATAGQEAQQFNNAAGQTRQAVERSGVGYGPSGTEASALSNLGGTAATSSASNYLQNLLNNESVKFQAAQGLNSAGQMVGAPQNQPNVSTQLPAQNLGSSIFGAGQLLKGLIPNGPSTPVANAPVGNLPLPTAPIFIPPTTEGFTGAS